MPLGANKAAIMGVAGVSTGDVVLIYNENHSNVSAAAITSGITATYGEYIIKCYNLNPVTDGANWTFQASTDGGSSYGVTVTTAASRGYHTEDDSATAVGYLTGRDLAQSTSYHQLVYEIDNAADASAATVLHLFNPASTTYVKNFYSRTAGMHSAPAATDYLTAGYFNTTSAINALNFKFDSGNFDGRIKMWGVKQ